MSDEHATSIDFVVPLYNERETLEALAKAIASHVGNHPYTILFIDDGSDDGSDAVLRDLAARDGHIGFIRFRRNLGKTAALAAGFSRSTADLVFTLDADLQDDPAEIPRFLEKLAEGYDLVSGWKQIRHDPWHKVAASHVYNGFIGRVFQIDLHDVNCGFKLMRRDVVKHVELHGDLHRLIPVLAKNLGYRVGEIAVQHHPRKFGRSKYGIERFARGALDTMAVWFVQRYRRSPGHFFAGWGLGFLACGLVGFAGGVVLLATGFVSWALMALFASTAAIQIGLGAVALGFWSELMLRHVARDNVNFYVQDEVVPLRENPGVPPEAHT